MNMGMKGYTTLTVVDICLLQALFRKIAAALPGMEVLSSAKQVGLVDVKLNPTDHSAQGEKKAGGCSCQSFTFCFLTKDYDFDGYSLVVNILCILLSLELEQYSDELEH